MQRTYTNLQMDILSFLNRLNKYETFNLRNLFWVIDKFSKTLDENFNLFSPLIYWIGLSNFDFNQCWIHVEVWFRSPEMMYTISRINYRSVGVSSLLRFIGLYVHLSGEVIMRFCSLEFTTDCRTYLPGRFMKMI